MIKFLKRKENRGWKGEKRKCDLEMHEMLKKELQKGIDPEDN
jgi:hypothetical protein